MSSALHPPLAGRTVLITGIQGFIGIHTAAAAYRLGARVAGMDIVAESARARRVRESLGAPPVEVRAVDLLDPQASGQALRAMRPDVVVHCAGSIERDAGTEDWARVFSGNAALTASLVEILRALPGTERPVLVMPGSQMEYGAAPMPWTEDQPCEPINAYGAGKLAATESVVEAARRDELRACVLRLPIVFGPGQPPALFVPELIGKALRKEAIPMTEGRQRRAFLYVEDAAGLLLEAAARAVREDAFPSLLNAPACAPVAIRELAEMLAGQLDATELLRPGALPNRAGEPLDAWPDIALAASLGLRAATPLVEALRKTVEWYQANPWFLA